MFILTTSLREDRGGTAEVFRGNVEIHRFTTELHEALL